MQKDPSRSIRALKRCLNCQKPKKHKIECAACFYWGQKIKQLQKKIESQHHPVPFGAISEIRRKSGELKLKKAKKKMSPSISNLNLPTAPTVDSRVKSMKKSKTKASTLLSNPKLQSHSSLANLNFTIGSHLPSQFEPQS